MMKTIVVYLSLCFISVICLKLLKPEILVGDLKNLDVSTGLYFVLCSVLSICNQVVVIRMLLVFGIENSSNSRETPWHLELYEYIKSHEILCYSIAINGLLFLSGVLLGFIDPPVSISLTQLSIYVKWALIILFTSILCASIDMIHGHDNVDLALSQHVEKSIGALWAYGAYTAFYEKVLSDKSSNITQRMTKFEKDNNVTFLVKKLVIICPLSCNILGSLDGRDGDISNTGGLEELEDDQGANLNRILKTTVYCINQESNAYIAAEMPSPLGTLFRMRGMMDKKIMNYHRDCFIQSLKALVQSFPCIILEYDDEDPSSIEPLHSFLLSKLRNNYQEKEIIEMVKE